MARSSTLWTRSLETASPQTYFAGGPPFRAGEVLIQFEPEVDPIGIARALATTGAQIAEVLRPASSEGLLARAVLPPGLDAAQAAFILSHTPGVKIAEPNWVYSTQATSNDPYYTNGSLWGMYGDQTSPANTYGSQAGEAWAAGQIGKTSVGVGVIDTGIDYTHPDLYLNVWLNQDEISSSIRSSLTDVNADGLITFWDLNQAANAAFVTDRATDSNSFIEAGDLLADPRWENGVDDDGNGYVDDLIGWDFVNNDNDPYDDHSHGTHVSGTIAATGGDGAGVAGVNWSAQIMALKFLDASGSGTSANAIKALDYLTNTAKDGDGVDFAASNNSWGGDAFSQLLLDGIVRGANEDLLFVAAAGNGNFIGRGYNIDSNPFYPASYSTQAGAGWDAVISVASITSSGSISSFSNYGALSVDLGAPGSSIYSTMPGGGYGTKSGTSMATPHVTGAILLYSALYGSGVSASDIKSALLQSTTPTASLLDKVLTDGRLDITSMLAIAPPAPDTTAPTQEAQNLKATDNDGPLVGALLTNDTTDDVTPLLSGSLSAVLGQGEQLVIYRDGSEVGTANVDGTSWTFQEANLAAGPHSWTALVQDLAGNQGPISAAFSLTIQPIVPFYGTTGSDSMVGDDTTNKFWGVPQAGSDTGKGDIDQMTGNGGADLFVLGAEGRGRFYDDGKNKTAGTGDYALIWDFTAGSDKIQLFGDSGRYYTAPTTTSLASGEGIYYDSTGNGFDGRDELIGLVVGGGSLNPSTDFLFV